MRRYIDLTVCPRRRGPSDCGRPGCGTDKDKPADEAMTLAVKLTEEGAATFDTFNAKAMADYYLDDAEIALIDQGRGGLKVQTLQGQGRDREGVCRSVQETRDHQVQEHGRVRQVPRPRHPGDRRDLRHQHPQARLAQDPLLPGAHEARGQVADVEPADLLRAAEVIAVRPSPVGIPAPRETVLAGDEGSSRPMVSRRLADQTLTSCAGSSAAGRAATCSRSCPGPGRRQAGCAAAGGRRTLRGLSGSTGELARGADGRQLLLHPLGVDDVPLDVVQRHRVGREEEGVVFPGTTCPPPRRTARPGTRRGCRP